MPKGEEKIPIEIVEKVLSNINREPAERIVVNIYVQQLHIPPPVNVEHRDHHMSRVAAFACLLSFVIFLMALIVASIFGHEIPSGSRMLVVFLLSVVLAIGSSFIVGEAVASGKLHIPSQDGQVENKLKFSVVGGFAIFVIAMYVGYLTYGKTDGVSSHATSLIGTSSVKRQ